VWSSLSGLLDTGVDSEGHGGGVYVLDDAAILKHYAGTVDSAYLTALQDFYASLDWSVLSYALPEIRSPAVEGDVCITVERKLPGTPMSAILSTLTKAQMDDIMRDTLCAALELNRHLSTFLPSHSFLTLFDYNTPHAGIPPPDLSRSQPQPVAL
jgi:hypothetical protein